MPRVRVSTTVDQTLLRDARAAADLPTDAALIDAALQAFLARHRAHEVDERYRAYDAHSLDEPDAWGDLASFREAAGSS
jgi:hypothetical protein